MKRLLALSMALAAPAQAMVVTSTRPDTVAVTVYRNPDRGDGDGMDLAWLRGFALITETRSIDLPAGDSEVRFEGVAGSMIPVSAIVTGLPGGMAEKNRDARLLSPAALIDGWLGRRVHLRRTSRATGAVRETDAVLRAGPGGGVILQTAEGIEALSCSGLPEALNYDGAPAGLSARPTLSVKTTSKAAVHAVVTLSYLAENFDWQANYVAEIAADGRHFDLFAWMTLANGNDETFPDAQAQAVAGTLNRSESDTGAADPLAPSVALACWPMGTTSDVDMPPPPPPPPPAPMMGGEDIIVTAQARVERLMAAPVAMTAVQEELGDLKLYRIPEAVTVAAHAQKQVALLARENIAFDPVYAARVTVGEEQDPAPAAILMRTKNVKERGLGLPLPSGKVAIFEQTGSRPMLAGETILKDAAIGNEIEWLVGSSPQIQVAQRALARGGDASSRRYEIEISNANATPATVEIAFILPDSSTQPVSPSHRLDAHNGRTLWIAKLPANGRATLQYKLVDRD
ncbi:DUF4139 domain-containing protein [Flavisphingomonas formosensis]|uniref:DUF4139 domain-containing protein n=1 Tax=Flavisphingomonas formosensis TaxID=861534 RepID=UPI0012FB7348|nr:hypothetical protein [Sphingomonas formosensis]